MQSSMSLLGEIQRDEMGGSEGCPGCGSMKRLRSSCRAESGTAG